MYVGGLKVHLKSVFTLSYIIECARGLVSINKVLLTDYSKLYYTISQSILLFWCIGISKSIYNRKREGEYPTLKTAVQTRCG